MEKIVGGWRTAPWLLLVVTGLCRSPLPLRAQQPVRWEHLSSRAGDLPEPNGGMQQTACVVFDIDGDGADDMVIGERTKAPSVVWIRYRPEGWQKFVIDPTPRRVEAGGWPCDLDGDGDLDLILGGDAASDELWWYENPRPGGDPRDRWKRFLIKQGGARAHHDQVAADLLGSGRPQVVFWNQGARKLFLAPVPKDPRHFNSWSAVPILDTSTVATANKQEGLDVADVDGDGRVDLLAGIFWLKHLGDLRFRSVRVANQPGRIRAARFFPDKAAQIVLAPGDADGPLWLLHCQGDPMDSRSWHAARLLPRPLVHGHTLEIGDINGDGHQDVFAAEMHTPGRGDRCEAWILYGDGKGNFLPQRLSVGIGNHDSRLGDVNGDGKMDIVTKPYTWDTPRLDVWLNRGPASR